MVQPFAFGRHNTLRRCVVTVLALSAPAAAFGPVSAQTPNTIPISAGQPVTVPETVPPSGNARVVAAAATSATETTAPIRSEARVPRYSDPLADLAAETLRAMKARGVGTVTPVTPAGSSVSPDTNVVVANGANNVGANVVVVSNQAQVVGAASPPSGASAGSTNWTSAVVSTDSLSDYLSGKAIEVPVAPSTQTILAKLPSDPQVRYASALRQVSLSVASRIKGAKAADLEAVWLRTDDRRMTVILTALAQVGTMYRYTGNQPGGFDCSGLTSYSWSRVGVKIPRISTDQIAAATPKIPGELAVADLIWHPGHIGLYLGVNDYMVHSPQTGKAVEVRPWGKAVRWGSPL